MSDDFFLISRIRIQNAMMPMSTWSAWSPVMAK